MIRQDQIFSQTCSDMFRHVQGFKNIYFGLGQS
jgi:hypothetical protein